MIEIKQVGERISRFRQKKGMTQIALAEKLGVTILNEDEFFDMVNNGKVRN